MYPTGVTCYEFDTDFNGNDINSNEDDVHFARGDGRRDSAQECQQLCASTIGCEFFTYHPDRKSCFLKTSDVGRKTFYGAISGPKSCCK